MLTGLLIAISILLAFAKLLGWISISWFFVSLPGIAGFVVGFCWIIGLYLWGKCKGG